MVSIRTFVSRGKKYYGVVKTFRENGRMKQTVIHYIGNESKLSEFLANKAQVQDFLNSGLENVLYQTPVTIWDLIEEMGLRTTFAKHMKKKWGVQPADAACVMILNYATDRHTKNTFSSWYAQTWLPYLLKIPSDKMNKDLLCRTMDFFTEKKIEEIHADVFKTVKEKFKLSDNLLLYDTTKITFEGDSCTLAKYGYNAGHLYAPQVSLAMPVTVEGFPTSHKVFDGGTKDSKTLQKSIELIEKAGAINETVFIFDRGVCSKPNFDLLELKLAKFICGYAKNSRIKKTIASIKPEQYTVIDDDVSFHETTLEKRRLVIYHSKKLEGEQHTFREKRIKKITEKLSSLSKTADKYEQPRLHEKIGSICGSYRNFFDVKTEPFSFNVKQTIVNNAASVEGRYAILTNTALDPKTVLERYRGRNFIEMCFKELKMFVDIRPVRHWKDARVLAHIFLAVLAFGVRSLMQLKLKRAGLEVTAEDAINQLNNVRALVVDGKVLRFTGETNDTKKIAAIIAKTT